jgi:hypothetical protein
MVFEGSAAAGLGLVAVELAFLFVIGVDEDVEVLLLLTDGIAFVADEPLVGGVTTGAAVLGSTNRMPIASGE